MSACGRVTLTAYKTEAGGAVAPYPFTITHVVVSFVVAVLYSVSLPPAFQGAFLTSSTAHSFNRHPIGLFNAQSSSSHDLGRFCRFNSHLPL